MANSKHIIAIRTALNRLGYTEDVKEALVSTYTGGNTISLREMTDRQASELRTYLNGVQKKEDEAAQVMRRKVISKYREMNYQVWSETKQGMIADMVKIQAHLTQHWKKKLNDYTNKELAAIISVLEEKWLPWFYKSKQNG